MSFMSQIEQDIKEVKDMLSDNNEKILVLVSEECVFCAEYVKTLKTMLLKNSDGKRLDYKVYNMEEDKVAKVLRILLGIKKLPSTVFMDKSNTVKFVIAGVLDQTIINKTIKGMEKK